MPPPEQSANEQMTREQVIEHYSRRIGGTTKFYVLLSLAPTLINMMAMSSAFEAVQDKVRREPVVLEYRQTTEYLKDLRQLRSSLGLNLPAQAVPQALKPELDAVLSDDRKNFEALDSLIAKAESHEREIKGIPHFKAYQEQMNQVGNALNKIYYGTFAFGFAFGTIGIYSILKDAKERDQKLRDYA